MAKASKPDNSDVAVAIVVSTVARVAAHVELVTAALQIPESEIMHNIIQKFLNYLNISIDQRYPPLLNSHD